MARQDDESLAVPGEYGYVRYARMRDGSLPTKEFCEGLDGKILEAFVTLCVALVSNPNLQLKNREKFKCVKDDLFEFKLNTHKMRIFGSGSV